MSPFLIREADLSDPAEAAHVLSLLNHYATGIMGGGRALSSYVQHHLITALRQRPSAVILLVFAQDIAVGLAIAFEGFSTFYALPLLNIHDFVVLESHRGKGIAKAMLEKMEEIAKERGCCKLTLEVLEGNLRAQKVYRDFGFSGYELDAQMGRALFWDKKLIQEDIS